jgi:hypothetical protein
MLILSITWLFLLVLTYLVGTAIIYQLGANNFKSLVDQSVVAVWLGIVTISISLLFVSIFVPLSLGVSWTIILLIIIITIVGQRSNLIIELKQIKESVAISNATIFFIAIVTVAGFVSRRIIWYDTGLYHFQLIRWYSQFGIIHGLALIHSRFGFNSSWFSLAAAFNTGIFESRLVALAGGFAFLMLILHFFAKGSFLTKKDFSFSDRFIYFSLFFGISFSIWIGFPISPSPDLPVMLLTLVVAWLFIKIPDDCVDNKNCHAFLVPTILSAGAVTFKVSAMPILLFSIVFYVLNKSQKFKSFIFVNFVSFAVLLPLFVANIFSSGCPVYPSSFACLRLPWALDPTKVKEVTNVIGNWAKWTGNPPDDANSWNWIMTWLTSDKLYFLNRQTALLILLSFLCLLGCQALSRKSQCARKIVNKNGIVLWLAGSGIVYFMATAPTLRFGIGYLLILPSFFLALCSYKMPKLSLVMAMAMVGILFSLKGSYSYYDIHTYSLITVLCYFLLMIVIGYFKFKIQTKTLVHVASLSLLGLAVATYWVSDQNYLAYSVKIQNSPEGNQTELFWFSPPPLMSTVKTVPQEQGQISYYRPEGTDQCWAWELMCTPESIDSIQFRIPVRGIEGGFIR